MKSPLAATLLLILAAFPGPATAQVHTGRVPLELTLPAGTLLTVSLTQPISSDRSLPGDSFTTLLEQPVVAQGWVLARRGQIVLGQVVEARPAGRVRGTSELGVELTEMVAADGQQIPLRTQLAYGSAGGSVGRDAGALGTTTGLGAAVGAAADGGRGAAIGAAIGAAAGIAGILSTQGRATELQPETVLTFRLESPVILSTAHAAHAFHPVNQRDYQAGGRQRLPIEHRPRYALRPYPRIGIRIGIPRRHYHPVRVYRSHRHFRGHFHGSHRPSHWYRPIRPRLHRHGHGKGFHIVYRVARH